MDRLTRTEMLLGPQAIDRLKQAHVAIFGLGGVGSWCAEALVRAGVGNLTLVDDDFVSVTNLNRQVQATGSSIGQPKAISMMLRLRDIAPEGTYTPKCFRYCAETREDFFNDAIQYDYVADAIDLVSCKLDLIETCIRSNVPIVSALGTGNKLDASAFCITDISKTSGCPLARVIRKELRSRGIDHLQVVYSPESPAETLPSREETPPPGRRSIPASASWVPPVAGFLMAQAIILDLTGQN
ncbi:MAG: tRNA threonylcarbamoyladenosine dehydratase [Oscillospiraceae bacterium]|nr:tRNA threonylcarbamoyladenosine dehydratase [Oscillospiraceae bacterium]